MMKSGGNARTVEVAVASSSASSVRLLPFFLPFPFGGGEGSGSASCACTEADSLIRFHHFHFLAFFHGFFQHKKTENRDEHIKGCTKSLGQGFSACFALKLPPQRGEGKKWEGVEISKTKHTEPLTQKITRPLYTGILLHFWVRKSY